MENNTDQEWKEEMVEKDKAREEKDKAREEKDRIQAEKDKAKAKNIAEEKAAEEAKAILMDSILKIGKEFKKGK
jgi:hypothetical protein